LSGKSAQQLASILAETFLFRGIEPLEAEESLLFFSECRFLRFPAGSTVQSAQSPVAGIAVLTDGQAEVLSSPGETAIRLRFMECGEIFGAAALYTENRNYETVVRASKDTEVLLIPEKTVKRLIRKNEQIAENYIRFLSERICFLNQKLSAFTAGSAEAKLAVYLSGLRPDPLGICTLPVSLSELAESLGMGRASLYRALEKFEENGIIERNGKHIRVLDGTALSATFRCSEQPKQQ